MKKYNWQFADWPQFQYHHAGIEDVLLTLSAKMGRITGLLDGLPDSSQQEVIIASVLAEAIKTSEIEGEFPNRKDVLSSIRKNLGLQDSTDRIKDRSADNLGLLMMDVRNSFKKPLTEKQLFQWHQMLLSEKKGIQIGQYRTHTEPMQILSGALGKEKIHFEAPPSSNVHNEMKKFIRWFNESGPGGKKEIKKGPVRAAITHLYFESIHPFEDGNGRIGRALAEKALSQSIGRPVILSLSRTIASQKKLYYQSLEKAQRTLEITPWIEYFVRTILEAQTYAEREIEFTLKTTRFFDRFKDQLNQRQVTVIRRMLKEGAKGFKGGMNAQKYIGITKTSKATATRDLQNLLEIGAFIRADNAGGRSTRYQVNL